MATASSGVGTYAFTVGSLAGANYTLVVAASPTFAVTPALLSIQPNSGQSKVYGAAVSGLTATATGFVNGDTDSVLTGALGTVATASSAVGTYAFTLGSLIAGPNYILAMAASPPTFAVTAAPLSIHPDTGQSKVYGAAVPGLTATAAGFVNGDTSSLLTGARHGSHVEQRGRHLHLHAGFLERGTQLRLGDGRLAANVCGHRGAARHPTGQRPIQGLCAAVPGLTETATGFVNGDTATLLTGALGTMATSSSAVGTYAFTVGSLARGQTTPWRWPPRRQRLRSLRRRSPSNRTPANPRSMARRCRDSPRRPPLSSTAIPPRC